MEFDCLISVAAIEGGKPDPNCKRFQDWVVNKDTIAKLDEDPAFERKMKEEKWERRNNYDRRQEQKRQSNR